MLAMVRPTTNPIVIETVDHRVYRVGVRIQRPYRAIGLLPVVRRRFVSAFDKPRVFPNGGRFALGVVENRRRGGFGCGVLIQKIEIGHGGTWVRHTEIGNGGFGGVEDVARDVRL